ncbi:MAG: hypothetical protein K0S46_1285 [Moraxellaceae bacterium]|jgi:uncharacterized membrane protein YheB (UPF0754 family)|nr:hypothetical protein [Moraxellaceae bacterium]
MTALTHFWQELTARPDFWGFISIPFVAAIVTWAHVWWAMQMVFYPLDFIGIKTPQLEKALGLHPFGWQGIIPRKARKMSDIVVERVIKKMGSVSDFLRQMEPEKVAAYVAESVAANIEDYTDEVMRERNSIFWDNMPVAVKKRIYAHARQRLPRIMDGVVQAMIEQIDELVDVKEMCGRQMEADRALVVRMFLEVGDQEIRFIINSSFWIGLAFGVVQMVLFWFLPWHGLLPLYAAVLGLLTNWLALAMVFRPVNPVKLGPFTIQGLFLRRQAEVADKFAALSAQEILTVHQFMKEVLTGARSARARQLIKRHVNRLIDDSLLARTGAQMAFGPTGFADLKALITDKSVHMALKPLSDKKFSRERATELATLFAGKMKEMTPAEFQDLLRPAFQEDEWILLVLGAITGLAAGTAQLLLGFA